MTKKRVKYPKKKPTSKPRPNPEPQKQMGPKDTHCFLSYSVGCIALQKLTFELEDYWKKDKIPMVVFDQQQFEGILKNQIWKSVILHRGGTHSWSTEKTPQFMTLLKHQKENGAKLFYYIDDFLVHMNNNLPIHLMKMCDRVIAKGYFLPEYLQKNEGLTNVEPLKTWINLEKFDSEAIKPASFKYPFNVLWFSAGRTGLGFIMELFSKLNPVEWKDTEWQIIGTGSAIYRAKLNRYRGLNKHYCEKIPLEVLYSMVKSTDIIINPLHPATDNAELAKLPFHRTFFNDAKVEIKFIIGGAGSKPLVTCSSKAYENCIDHGQNGYMTNDVDEWETLLRQLKNDRDLRDTIGNRARIDVETYYEASQRWPRIKELFELNV